MITPISAWSGRGENRRVDARVQLRAAHDVFVTGMSAFVERAKRELVATGEHVRARAPQARDDPTGQQLQIAELARDGLSNPEIGARLFLSPRTVEWQFAPRVRKARDPQPSRDLHGAAHPDHRASHGVRAR